MTLRVQRTWLALLALVIACMFACGTPSPAPGSDASVSDAQHLVGGAYPAAGGDLSGSSQNASVVSLSGSAGSVAVNASTLVWGSGTAPLLAQNSTSAATGASFGFCAPQASTANPGTPGNCIANIPAPVGTGAEGSFVVQFSGAPILTINTQGTKSSSYGAITFPGSAGILGNGGNITLEHTGSIAIQYAGQTTTVFQQNGAQFGPGGGATPSFGGGNGVIGLSNAATAPTTNPTGGVLWQDATNGLEHRGSNGVVYGLAPLGAAHNTQLATVLPGMGFLHSTAAGGQQLYTTPTLTVGHVVTLTAVVQCIDTVALTSSAGATISSTWIPTVAGSATQLGATTVIANHNFTTAPGFTHVSGATVTVTVTPNTANASDCQASVAQTFD